MPKVTCHKCGEAEEGITMKKKDRPDCPKPSKRGPTPKPLADAVKAAPPRTCVLLNATVAGNAVDTRRMT